MKDIVLNLPWPPTVNTYYRHVGPKVLISREGRQYRQAVACEVFAQSPFNRTTMDGRIALEIVAHPPDRRKRDLDNLLKGLLDSLQHAGTYEDDSQIDEIRIKRSAATVDGGAVYVRLSEINGGDK